AAPGAESRRGRPAAEARTEAEQAGARSSVAAVSGSNTRGRGRGKRARGEFSTRCCGELHLRVLSSQRMENSPFSPGDISIRRRRGTFLSALDIRPTSALTDRGMSVY